MESKASFQMFGDANQTSLLSLVIVLSKETTILQGCYTDEYIGSGCTDMSYTDT